MGDKNTSAKSETFTLKYIPGNKPKVNRGFGKAKKKHTTSQLKLTAEYLPRDYLARAEHREDHEEADTMDKSTDLQSLHLVPKSCLHHFPTLRQASSFFQLLLQTHDASAEFIILLLGLPKCGLHCCPPLPQHCGLLLSCQLGLRAVGSSGSDHGAWITEHTCPAKLTH